MIHMRIQGVLIMDNMLLNIPMQYMKTTDKTYQEKLNRLTNVIPHDCLSYYITFEDEQNTYYDIIPKPEMIKDFIFRKTTFIEYVETIDIFTVSMLNPFELEPIVYKTISDMNQDYVAYYMAAKLTPYKLGKTAFNMLLDVVDKTFKRKLRDFINIGDKLNYYIEAQLVEDYYIIAIKIDPQRRNIIKK